MSNPLPTLLPAGLYDLLPPAAAHERYVTSRLVDAFERFGYQQVSPPLMEFETSLLKGQAAKAFASQTFRVMDPKSQEMMGFRPDMTLQVGRIASGRLADWPRPLRLGYGGSTLRVKGEGKEGARQWRQAGIECIGAATPEADAEVIAVAVQAVFDLGVKELVLDINLPGLVKHLLDESDIISVERVSILHAVECKDSGSVAAANLKGYASILPALISAAGEAQTCLAMLESQNLPDQAKKQIAHVKAVLKQLKLLGVPVSITIDPVENRGFEYHSTISFALFSRIGQSELGRGGRYVIAGNGEAETATGITIYVNPLMEAVALEPPLNRLLVPGDLTLIECRELQDAGYAVIRALGAEIDFAIAREQQCSHIWQQGRIVSLTDQS